MTRYGKNFAGIIALLLLFTGCSATGPKFQDTPFASQQAPGDKARIVFLRESHSFGGARSVPLEIDSVAVGKVANGGFLVIDPVSGEREISTSLWDTPGRFTIKMDVQAGQTYYIAISPRTENAKYGLLGVFGGLVGGLVAVSLMDDKGSFKLELVDQEQALKTPSELKLSE